jgi:hypothetical protein
MRAASACLFINPFIIISAVASLYLIVGIDPGTTIGIAALDLNGNLITATSGKEMGKEEAVRNITEIGIPSLIACDVTPIPGTVLKIAAYFNVPVSAPKRELREEDKVRESAGVKGRLLNNHERDAYVAALRGYKEHANRFRHIDTLEMTAGERDKAKHLLLNGYSLSNALLLVTGGPIPSKEKIEETDLRKVVESLSLENSNLKKSIARMAAERELLIRKIDLLEKGVEERVRRDEGIQRRDRTIYALRKTLDALNKNIQGKGKWKKEQLKTFSNNVDLEKIIGEYRKTKSPSSRA